MKNIRIKSKKIIQICMSTFLASIIFSGTVLGTDIELSTTKEFDNWLEDKTIPKSYDYEIPENILEKYSIDKNVPHVLLNLFGIQNTKLQNISASYTDSSYNLADEFNIKIKNQGITNECWAISILTSLETNVGKVNKIKDLPDFSVRHMDYATSKTFLNNEINEKGFNREVGEGGMLIEALAYLTNGQGAVLEENMPFENNENKIFLSEINKKVDTVATGYTVLPTLKKIYDESGKVSYFNNNDEQYTDSQVQAIRNIIKEHIVKYGAVSSMTAASYEQYYNYDRTNSNANLLNSTAYFCNDTNIKIDHAITIVGWDDNYSRNNFNESCRPSSDGAYIVLNSYGKNNFNNGFLYISYEDVWIERELYVITDSKKVDYDNIYQYDFYGGIMQIGTSSENTGYYSNVYYRDNSKEETLNNVGVTVPGYVDIEIYVNPNGKDMDSSSLVKIGEAKNLEPGYHRIDVSPTKLTGESFAIVIKQTSKDGTFYFSIETNFDGTAYSVVDSEGESYVSFDCEEWKKLSSYIVSGVDMKKSDVCIKAFTTLKNIDNEENSNKMNLGIYKLQQNYIMNISYDTTIKEFKNNIKTDSKLKIIKEDNQEITNDNELIKTGLKMIVDDKEEYILVVRGDINCDGKVTLTDLSKLILHYNEVKGNILTGCQERGADLNIDGKVSLVDLSQLIVLYNSFI